MKILKAIKWIHSRINKFNRKKIDKRRQTWLTIEAQQIPKKKQSTIFPRQINSLQKGTSKDYRFKGTFCEAISPVLLMAQIFGTFPIIGINGRDAFQLRYKFKCFRTIYSLVICILITCYASMTVYISLNDSIELDNFVPVVFYTMNVFAMFSFSRLATKWPELMQQWQKIESKLPPYKTEFERSRLAYRIKMITLVVMFLSLSEHILNTVSIVNVNSTAVCSQRSDSDRMKDFFMAQLSQLFYFTSYSPYKAIFGKIINVISTFLWTFTDLFVMLVSVGLSARFKQINDSLMRHKGMQMPENFWTEHRLHYRNMCILCDLVDNAISKITMVSFTNNLYFICITLLRSLNKMSSVPHAVYFWFSLTFLIARTLAVSLYSAEINDESKGPIRAFRAVPKESWCIEVKRFSDEVINDVVALSGMKFFYLTRKLVLSVAGTIVTYELVLIQFHEDKEPAEEIC